MSDRRARPFRFSVQAFEAQSGRSGSASPGGPRISVTRPCSRPTTTRPGDISDTSGHRPVDVAPLTAMTAAAMATTRLRVGCRVFCVDYHHPVVLAKELATLDMLSQGRVEVGLGAGWVAPSTKGSASRWIARACGSNGWRRPWSAQGALGGEPLASRARSSRRPASPGGRGRCSSRIRRSSSGAALPGC